MLGAGSACVAKCAVRTAQLLRQRFVVGQERLAQGLADAANSVERRLGGKAAEQSSEVVLQHGAIPALLDVPRPDADGERQLGAVDDRGQGSLGGSPEPLDAELLGQRVDLTALARVAEER